MKAKEKLYFSKDIDECWAYHISFLLQEMQEMGLKETIITEAVRETGTKHYFCKELGEIGDKSNGYESCGKNRDCYEPRNGKSGCCKHRGYCYEPSDIKYLLKSTGELIDLPL